MGNPQFFLMVVTAISPQSSLSIAACRLCLQIYNGWLRWIKIREKCRL